MWVASERPKALSPTLRAQVSMSSAGTGDGGSRGGSPPEEDGTGDPNLPGVASRAMPAAGAGAHHYQVTFGDKKAFLASVGRSREPVRHRKPKKADAVSIAAGAKPATLSGSASGPMVGLEDGALPSSPMRTRRLLASRLEEQAAEMESWRAATSTDALRHAESASRLEDAISKPHHLRSIQEEQRLGSVRTPPWAVLSSQPVVLSDSARVLSGTKPFAKGLLSASVSAGGALGDSSLGRTATIGRESTTRKLVAPTESAAAHGTALGLLPSGTVPRRPMFAVAGAAGPVHKPRGSWVRPHGRADTTRPGAHHTKPPGAISERRFDITSSKDRHVRPTKHVGTVGRSHDAEIVPRARSSRHGAAPRPPLIGPQADTVRSVRYTAAKARKGYAARVTRKLPAA